MEIKVTPPRVPLRQSPDPGLPYPPGAPSGGPKGWAWLQLGGLTPLMPSSGWEPCSSWNGRCCFSLSE